MRAGVRVRPERQQVRAALRASSRFQEEGKAHAHLFQQLRAHTHRRR